jgi:hypothetical protein
VRASIGVVGAQFGELGQLSEGHGHAPLLAQRAELGQPGTAGLLGTLQLAQGLGVGDVVDLAHRVQPGVAGGEVLREALLRLAHVPVVRQEQRLGHRDEGVDAVVPGAEGAQRGERLAHRW